MQNTTAPRSDIDLFGDEALLDTYKLYQDLRDSGPVVRMDRLDAHAMTRFGDVRSALRNWQAFSSARGVSLNEQANAAGGSFTITSDPPAHTVLRSLSAKPLLPGAVRELSHRIETEAAQLADRLVARGTFDAVADLAWHLPLTIVLHLVGLAEDARQKMAGWAEASFDAAGPPNQRAAQNMPKLMEFLGF